MRLAYFSPFQPQQSGISDYSEELLPHLAQHAEIDLFFDGDTPTNGKLSKQFAIHPIHDFPALRRQRRYDTSLYQIGNNVYHTAIYTTLRQYSGITVLHEHTLHHFLLHITAGQGNWASYWRELAYNTSPAFMSKLPPRTLVYSSALPLARRVIDLSLGVIVHNQEIARRVRADNPRTRLAVVPMGMPLPPLADTKQQSAIRRKLNLPTDTYIVATFGHLNATKRIDVILRAFAQLRQQWPNALYLIVGKIIGVDTDTPVYDLPALCAEVGLDPQAVQVTGFVPHEALSAYIQAMDVCVNLRYPVFGETSAATLRVMAYGKPIIVSDVSTFADLPDNACMRVVVNAAEVEFLYRCLLLLAQRPEFRLQLGRNARRYIEEYHTLEHAASQMATAIQNILIAVEKDN